MSEFYKGVEVNLEKKVSQAIVSEGGIIGLIGTAGNIRSDENNLPLAKVNVPVLIESEEQALKTFGAPENDINSTIPKHLAEIYKNSNPKVIVLAVVPDEGTENDSIPSIVGTFDEETEQYTGIKALKINDTGYQPDILIAPIFSSLEANRTELFIRAKELKAVAFVDFSNVSKAVAIAESKNYGADEEHSRIIACYPYDKVKYGVVETLVGKSAYAACLLTNIDFWESPSNRVYTGSLGNSKPVSWNTSMSHDANDLNSNRIVTSIKDGGMKLWGNRTLVDMENKFSFIHLRRLHDKLVETLYRASMDVLDRGVTAQYIQEVTGMVNDIFRRLALKNAILGGECKADPKANPATNIKQGNVTFSLDYTPVYIAERITYNVDINDKRIIDIFGGQ